MCFFLHVKGTFPHALKDTEVHTALRQIKKNEAFRPRPQLA